MMTTVHRFKVFARITVGILSSAACLRAADITGYSTVVNNRFASGFPLAPVENGSGSFVGAGYDWSPIAWSTATYASSSYKGFAVLSPKHFLAAQHYEYTTELTSGIRVLDGTGTVQTRTVESMTNTGYGLVLTNRGFTNPDVAVGTLSSALEESGKLPRLGVLDLYSSSTSGTTNTDLSVYTGTSILLNGRTNSTPNGSPVVGAATIEATAFNGDTTQPFIRTTHADVQLEVGDSGHAALHGWTNPNGDAELTVLGANSATDSTNGFNYISMLAQKDVMASASSIMAADGFALRIVGPTVAEWSGGSGGPANSDNIGFAGNWDATPTDQHVLFDAATASVTAIEVNAATNLRGLYFKDTGTGADGFTFGGASTLTVGRGGVTNYDGDRQTFTAGLSLGANQYWDVGTGGVTAGNIATNGNLLEFGGTGTVILNGVVSGSGGLALSGERLEVSGTSTYTGGTWVHDGELNVSGDLSASSGVEVGAYGTVAGSGVVAGLSGSGLVSPGNSPGILTTSSVDPSGGLDFQFEFTALGGPDYTDAAASIQDVLRITDASPFSSSLTAANTVEIYLDVAGLTNGDTYQGGFFTDTASDFLSQISGADFQYYLATPGGSVSYNGVTYELYSGSLSFSVSTVSESADFGSGTIDGQIMQFVAIPESASLVLAAIMLTVFGVLRPRGDRE